MAPAALMEKGSLETGRHIRPQQSASRIISFRLYLPGSATASLAGLRWATRCEAEEGGDDTPGVCVGEGERGQTR